MRESIQKLIDKHVKDLDKLFFFLLGRLLVRCWAGCSSDFALQIGPTALILERLLGLDSLPFYYLFVLERLLLRLGRLLFDHVGKAA